MKIICVSGGSYKSFYLNYFKKINKCDLLIFNFGIIYNYNVKEELMGSAVVTKELLYLSKQLGAVVVAGVIAEAETETKSIIICDKEKINLVPAKYGAKLFINKKEIIIGDEKMHSFKCDKIILSNKRIYPNLANCSQYRNYVFCDNFGVSIVKNKKFIRNFNKYSKIILK